MELRLPIETQSVAEARRRAHEFLAGHGIAGALLTDLELAIGEAVTNAVEHGGPCAGNYFVVRIAVNGVVKIEVCDCGHFDEQSPEAASGIGLELIRRVSDDVTLQVTEGRTLIRLQKALASRTRSGLG